jgi:peroxiredoxin
MATMAIEVGSPAPVVAGVDLEGPRALVFFKVTCGTTQLATPAIERLAQAHPGRVVGLGQDPPPALEAFARTYALTLPLAQDPPPYAASDAYGIASAPTLVIVDGSGTVADVAESWDRDAWNRAAATLAGLTGGEPRPVSQPGDGLPDFKPG